MNFWCLVLGLLFSELLGMQKTYQKYRTEGRKCEFSIKKYISDDYLNIALSIIAFLAILLFDEEIKFFIPQDLLGAGPKVISFFVGSSFLEIIKKVTLIRLK